MAFFEVLPPEYERDGNPYRAYVGGTEELNTGQIRIEPPFSPSAEYLEFVKGDVSVNLEHMLTSEHATLLRFNINSGFGSLTNEARVRATVEHILLDLGTSAVLDYFRQEHDGSVPPEQPV